MVAVGSRGLLGGVWRSPPLALAEFSTSPAELLNPHSLAGLRALLKPGDTANGCLAAAVRAQVLRVVALEVSIRHNQVSGRQAHVRHNHAMEGRKSERVGASTAALWQESRSL
jgi:hypothetical protein